MTKLDCFLHRRLRVLRVTRCWVVGGFHVPNARICAYLYVYKYPMALQMGFARLEGSVFL